MAKDSVLTPFLPKKKLEFEKDAFYAWLEAGTCNKARNVLAQRGIVNPNTGKPYAYMAVYFAAYRHLLYNHEALKPVLFDLWGMRAGVDMTQKEWEIYLVRKAMMVLGNSSKSRFLKWIEDNSWAKEYDYLYAKRFGLR